MKHIGRISIGTSGWYYPHWVGPFYPSGMASEEFLPFYARHLSTVEINNTFYQLPTPHMLREWEKETPENFLFACKGSRFITHMKKLKDPEQSVKRFFEIHGEHQTGTTPVRGRKGGLLMPVPLLTKGE